MNNKRTGHGTDDKCSTDLCLDKNRLSCEKKLDVAIHLALVGPMAAWQAGKIWVDYKFLKFTTG